MEMEREKVWHLHSISPFRFRFHLSSSNVLVNAFRGIIPPVKTIVSVTLKSIKNMEISGKIET